MFCIFKYVSQHQEQLELIQIRQNVTLSEHLILNLKVRPDIL